MKRDLYQSEAWLRRKYLKEYLSCAVIGVLCGVNAKTVWRWLKWFDISTWPRGWKRGVSRGLPQVAGVPRRRLRLLTRMKGGYIRIWIPQHPYANWDGYVLRARLVMERMLGRYLKPEEVIHHKNRVTDNDRPCNLRLFASNGVHLSYHREL
jgi:hypothetical protein